MCVCVCEHVLVCPLLRLVGCTVESVVLCVCVCEHVLVCVCDVNKYGVIVIVFAFVIVIVIVIVCIYTHIYVCVIVQCVCQYLFMCVCWRPDVNMFVRVCENLLRAACDVKYGC